MFMSECVTQKTAEPPKVLFVTEPIKGKALPQKELTFGEIAPN